jgi:transcriptional regulator with XRE-family HTH domain
MAWEGKKLKILAKERRIALTKIANKLNVSRQSVNDWINGQAPRGTHLIELSKIFGINPNYFFSDEFAMGISAPLHRKRGVAKVTEQMRQEAFNIAKQYEKLFKWAPDPGLIQVLRVDNKDNDNAISLATKLRQLSGIDNYKPMDYQHTFKLLYSLSIIPIFRYFPIDIKGYAFYCKIHKYRVVFVNNNTNILDLIFPLLHETIHAVSDDESEAFSQLTEDFCDSVASYTQFPKDYVNSVYNAIKDRPEAIQINILKDFSSTNSHSMFGIVKLLENLDTNQKLRVGGANSNLRKRFLTIGDILFKDHDPSQYIQKLRTLSPLFIDIVLKQINNATITKAGEWLGLESILDIKQVIEELRNTDHDNSLL